MYVSSVLALALAVVTIHACPSGEFGCDHPGNFTGNRAFPIPSISEPSQPLTPPPQSPCSRTRPPPTAAPAARHPSMPAYRPPSSTPQSASLSHPPPSSPYPNRTLSRDDRSESPCGAPLNITNPHTKKTILASVLGECTMCEDDDIQLTTAGLAALSPSEFSRPILIRFGNGD